MSMTLRFPKWGVTVLSILALFTTLIFGPTSNASASINYGEEVSEVAKRYVGAPYKWGGTTPKGFDASGFTHYVYKTAATKMTLPRTSASQYKMGKVVKQNELKQGDLVFYATGQKTKVSFVGIYNGNGTFTGATSKGVKVVKMSDKYWKERYVGAKRVIK
ncbi:C40 family peptidase [Metabacillus litoralis]|jgi:murein DD-endopeptidase|uniref:C40 family peptidase n=1 Tax=Metabacillus litoralis TaxID=152268 RepID=UPI00203E65D0|nr:C40 family peptidase [Metabacillus litoralis]MCM3654336.1 C40 family peptidase [Metabacillus litoralis]